VTENNCRMAVIIINWNNAAATLRSVSQVLSWQIPGVQVIVVDNGSMSGDLAAIEGSDLSFSLIKNNANLGYSGGNNAGILRALDEKYPYVMLLNSDVLLKAPCVDKLLGYLDRSGGTGVVGPLLEESGTLYAGGQDIGKYSRTRVPFKPGGARPGPVSADYVPGTVFLARREAFEKTGLLDDEFFFSGEIADFCRRLSDEGLTCEILCECSATHDPDTGSKMRDMVYSYYTVRNRFLYVRKHYRYVRFFLTVRWVIGDAIQIILAVVAGKSGRAHALWYGLRDGLKGRFGNRNDLFSV
jgi:GT2 family glycosyltransferase